MQLNFFPDDLIVAVFSQIQDSDSYYSARRVCHRFNQLGQRALAIDDRLFKVILTQKVCEAALTIFDNPGYFDQLPPEIQQNRLIVETLLCKRPDRFFSLSQECRESPEIKKVAFVAAHFLHVDAVLIVLREDPDPSIQQCMTLLEKYDPRVAIPPVTVARPDCPLWAIRSYNIYCHNIELMKREPGSFRKHMLPRLTQHFKDDPNVARQVVHICPKALKDFDPVIRDSKRVVIPAVVKKPSKLKYASDRLKNDKVFVLEILGRGVFLDENYIDPRVRLDPEVTEKLAQLQEVREKNILEFQSHRS